MMITDAGILILFFCCSFDIIYANEFEHYFCGDSSSLQNKTHYYRISIWHDTQQIHLSTIFVATGNQYQVSYSKQNVSQVIQINDINQTYQLLSEACKQNKVRVLEDGNWNITYHISLGIYHHQIHRVIQLNLKNTTDLQKSQLIVTILKYQNAFLKRRIQQLQAGKIFSIFIIITVSFLIICVIVLWKSRKTKQKKSQIEMDLIEDISQSSSAEDCKLNLKTKDAQFFTVNQDVITKAKGDQVYHHLTIDSHILQKQTFRMQVLILNTQKRNVKLGFVTQNSRNQYSNSEQSIYYNLSNLSKLPNANSLFKIQQSVAIQQEKSMKRQPERQENQDEQMHIQIQLNRRKNMVSWFINNKRQIHFEIPHHLKQAKLYPSLALKNVNDKVQVIKFWKLETFEH